MGQPLHLLLKTLCMLCTRIDHHHRKNAIHDAAHNLFSILYDLPSTCVTAEVNQAAGGNGVQGVHHVLCGDVFLCCRHLLHEDMEDGLSSFLSNAVFEEAVHQPPIWINGLIAVFACLQMCQ